MGGKELPGFDHEEAPGPSGATFPVTIEKPERNAKCKSGGSAMAAGTQNAVRVNVEGGKEEGGKDISMHQGMGV